MNPADPRSGAVAPPPRCYTLHPSPVGELLLCSDGDQLTGLYLPQHRGGPSPGADWRRDAGAFRAASAQLDAYFAGELKVFELAVDGAGTRFQRKVWQALSAIPYGVSISYADLATRIGQPGAARAVGLANGRNPVSIIVPCHRVIGASGALTGYGGGVERKRWLLRHEGVRLRDDVDQAGRPVQDLLF